MSSLRTLSFQPDPNNIAPRRLKRIQHVQPHLRNKVPCTILHETRYTNGLHVILSHHLKANKIYARALMSEHDFMRHQFRAMSTHGSLLNRDPYPPRQTAEVDERAHCYYSVSVSLIVIHMSKTNRPRKCAEIRLCV